MPEKEEFKKIMYNLIKYLEENKSITLLSQQEELEKEIENLYDMCEKKLEVENGKKRF